MTRKDYVLIAAAIVATQERIKASKFGPIESNGKAYPIDHAEQLRGVRRTAAHLCDALGQDNPPRGDGGGFNATQFLKACGYGGTTMNPRDPALDLRPLPGEETQRYQSREGRTYR